MVPRLEIGVLRYGAGAIHYVESTEIVALLGENSRERERERGLGGVHGQSILQDALRRIGAHPERVAERTPKVSRKMLAAGGSAIAAAVGKRIAKRLVSAT